VGRRRDDQLDTALVEWEDSERDAPTGGSVVAHCTPKLSPKLPPASPAFSPASSRRQGSVIASTVRAGKYLHCVNQKDKLQWALNLYLLDENMPGRKSSSADYKQEEQEFKDKSDLYTNAVLCILNNTDSHPGKIPRPKEQTEQREQQEEASRDAECRLADLPPLLGDPAAHLVAWLGLAEPGDEPVDRLSANHRLGGSLLSRDVDPSAFTGQIKHVLEKLPDPFSNKYDTTSKWMQKSLWRLVQDHIWRHLVFVRPGHVADVDRRLRAKKEPPKDRMDLHRLSLRHCQTEGLKKMVQGVSNCAGWTSFKHAVRELATERPGSQGRAAGGGVGGSGVQLDADTKLVVCFNLVQMLIFTQQFGKALVQLTKMGPAMLAEAAHMAIGLRFYRISVELDELGDKSGDVLLVSLVSQLLNSELVLVAPRSDGGAPEEQSDAQLRRVIQ